jgi:hypothetical protein
MPVDGNLRILNELIHTETLELSTPSETFDNLVYPVTDGTDDDQMDLLWHDQRTLAASASEDLDLSGSLVDAFGATMAFAEVRLIMVKASTSNSNDVLVGGASANQFINWVGNASDVVVVKPGGILLLYTPVDGDYEVTAGTGDLLQIENSDSGTAITYDIYIGGTSA